MSSKGTGLLSLSVALYKLRDFSRTGYRTANRKSKQRGQVRSGRRKICRSI